ncbi:DNA damage-induced apoptosis suppressor protein [Micropterus dolomieu]|uniref:DNA damage-induced apoptosis suppressor protein n=1 Tax=Micropterus dolomieu TaxID=147949 RepID=UPI001E8CCAB8|nr:DNA damage-induced apoptosis suppressor protein [Micropterus dolomieu]
MSVRRALVDCVVLSLQDACVVYPCCKGCFSRIYVEQQDTTRCRCSKCGYSCPREQVEHRYRLSLRVARERCIFGVTVFGTCLNVFFGLPASGLQRLVENSEGPAGASARSTFLVKAVEDCFIGRHFVFGIKVTETERRPWLGGAVANGSSSKNTVQFIASQMILPKATGLEGCTVVSYYRILLQKAAELGSSRPPAATLLLIPRLSPAGSFSNASLCASGLLSQSLQRSQYQDCSLTPTPPWQQSLGLVTSSAEQEESYCTQDIGDENSRPTDNNRTPHPTQRGCLENHKGTDETELSPLLSLECSSNNSQSLAKYPYSSVEKAVGNTSILKSWFSISSPGHSCSKAKGFSSRQHPDACLSSSLAWEDLPFSESLTEYLCEENQDVALQNHKKTARNNLEVRSQDKNLQLKSASVCQGNTEITDSHSQILLDVTNTPAVNEGDRHGLSEQVCESTVGCVSKSPARNISSHKYNPGDEKASSLSFDNEEEQLEGDTYNCSADLFSSSLQVDMNTNMLDLHAESVRMTTDACSLLSMPDKPHVRSETSNVPHSTPDTHKLKSNKCNNRESLIPPGTHDLDFIPPIQSTPIVKVAVLPGSPAASYRTLTVGEFISLADSRDSLAFSRSLTELDSKKPAKITSSLCKLNYVSANRLPQRGRESTKESRHSHGFTLKRRFCKPDKHKNHLLTQHHLRIQREVQVTGPTGRTDHKSDCDVTVCDWEDSEVIIVPPTPAAKTGQSQKHRRMQTEISSSNLGCTWEGKWGDGVNSKRSLLDQTLTSSQRGLAQTGNCDSEIDEGSLNGSNCYLLDDQNEACDWSRDLFSDSV